MSVEKLPHNPGVLLQPSGRQLVYSISEELIKRIYGISYDSTGALEYR